MVEFEEVEDRELGKGRLNDDSLSSRECSPQPGQARSFSPASDDGDLVSPIADDDTPPPPERPLIRQAVAFSSLSSGPLNVATYQAALPTNTTSSNSMFLPGQEVPPPLPPLKVKQATGVTKRKTKKVRHFNDEFSSQTSSFRLKSYNPPTPSTSTSSPPPLQAALKGNGPYSSAYRASIVEVSSTIKSVGLPTPNGKNSETGSTNNGTSTPIGSPTLANSPPISLAPQQPNKPRKCSQGRMKPRSSTSRKTASAGRRGGSNISPGPPDGASLDNSLGSQAVPSLYPPPNPCLTSQEQSLAVQQRPPNLSSDEARRPILPIAVVTILIQDIRSGITDHQLAEVKVPLKRADIPEDGWWADAKDISDKLQSSPSRIDGPAKVYTLRGKYRQFFLRVSADNKDETLSANIIITPQRTLEVVVEAIPPPGGYFRPPQIPPDIMERTPSPERSPPPSPRQVISMHRSPSSVHSNRPPDSRRKRQLSFDRYEASFRDSRPGSSLSVSSRTSKLPETLSSHLYDLPSPTPRKKRSYAKGSLEHIMSDTGNDDEANLGSTHFSWQPELHSDSDTDLSIAYALSPFLEKDSWWTEFYKSKGRPQIVAEVLKQYKFVQQLLNEWVGKPAPFNSDHHLIIQKRHVLQALRLDEKWGSDCTETLWLLDCYGPGGRRQPDPVVMTLIKDESLPPYGAKPIKRLLHRLREVDQAWNEDNSFRSARRV